MPENSLYFDAVKIERPEIITVLCPKRTLMYETGAYKILNQDAIAVGLDKKDWHIYVKKNF